MTQDEKERKGISEQLKKQEERRPAKVPFHEQARMLVIQCMLGISGDFRAEKVGGLTALLGLLEGSRMPASAAHDLAHFFVDFPAMLIQGGEGDLARFFNRVLEDLRTRKDE